jgi:hypothetical protein
MTLIESSTDSGHARFSYRKPMNRLLTALALLVAVSACVGGDRTFPNPTAPSPTPAPAPPAVLATQVRIAGNTSLTAVGETSQLTTSASFGDGTEKDVTAETIWTSSDPTVATVSAGLVTVQRFGATTVGARYQNRFHAVVLRPTPAGTFVVAGRAREPGQGGIAGVTVTDTISLRSASTDSDGYYSLASLPRRETRLTFSKDGHEPAELNATQETFGDVPLQRIIRVRAGEKVTSTGFAPNDFTYMVGGERCSPCRLVRVVADAPGTFHFRVTWSDIRATLTLWANGSLTRGSTSPLEADLLVPQGESIVYLGMTSGVGGLHLPFTIETTVP